MAVYYIHFWLPCSEITLRGSLPTFFYFGITLLPCKLHVKCKETFYHCNQLLCLWGFRYPNSKFSAISTILDLMKLKYNKNWYVVGILAREAQSNWDTKDWICMYFSISPQNSENQIRKKKVVRIGTSFCRFQWIIRPLCYL